MKDKIKEICKNIEKEKNIRILFAVENGSRAWRINSKDSDYDVRFVFVRPVKEYIQINKPAEVIDTAFDKEGNPCTAKGAFIDISGFDVFKYVKMLSSSNPTTIEWLMSDIVYYGKQNEKFKKFAIEKFNKISLYYHYKSLCRNNYLKYLKSRNLITYKKYLYAYRGLINAKWVVHKKSVPPIIFREALNNMKNIIPGSILNKLNEIIDLKSQGKEKELIQNIVEMDDYIESFLKDDSEAFIKETYSPLTDLNEELRKIVLKYKKSEQNQI
ncbi:nucleotidyltransferase domain-containing protein [archaeon]|nr:nucleotidyltransferase domain-containing protein [archaeon]